MTSPALADDRLRVAKAAAAEKESDAEQRRRIAQLPQPTGEDKRVVSYGLYGSNPKYTTGAIRNSELVKVYFPGWVARFYCDSSVPKAVLQQLQVSSSNERNKLESIKATSLSFMVVIPASIDCAAFFFGQSVRLID